MRNREKERRRGVFGVPVFLVRGSSPIEGRGAGVEMSERESEQLTNERYIDMYDTYIRTYTCGLIRT